MSTIAFYSIASGGAMSLLVLGEMAGFWKFRIARAIDVRVPFQSSIQNPTW